MSQCREQNIRVNTRPGDVIAGGTGRMGPCAPPQHQPPGKKVEIKIYMVYGIHIPDICHAYIIETGIYLVYIWYIPGMY